MKLSMMTYTMARGLAKGETFDVPALCKFCNELKIDGVDWVSLYGHDPKLVRKVMDDHGLRTVCHTVMCDFSAPTAAERAPQYDTFKKGIEAAGILGTDKVMLPLRGRKDQSREDSYKHDVQGLRDVIGIAEKAGVTVMIENFPAASGPFITSAEVNRAVADVPQLRLTFDNGNVTTGGEDPYASFKNSARWVLHSHFKDFAVCPPDAPGASLNLDGKYRRAVLVGDGDVDQLGGLRAMKECGYNGYINFEYEGREYTPRDATIEGARRIRSWIAGLG